MPAISTLFLALVAAIVVATQLWFWRLRLHEERTIWLGCAFLAAVASLIGGTVVLLMMWFPGDQHPWATSLEIALVLVPTVLLMVFPVVLVATLIVSGIRLVRREGRTPRNMLSLALGIAMVAYVAIWPAVRRSLVSIPYVGAALDFVFGFLAVVLLILSVAFTFYTVAGMVARIPHRRRRYDAIVVLGAALKADGTVTPLLGNRVRKGIACWKEHPEARLIMSGGQGSDEAKAESHAMRDFALSQGVPANSVLVEDRSTSTYENLAFSQELREREGLEREGRVLVVSDDYHVFRALLITRQLGFPADGAGSRVRIYFSLNALVREWVAYVHLRRTTYMRFFVALLALYVVLAVLPLLVGT